jgi:hypothetical protein
MDKEELKDKIEDFVDDVKEKFEPQILQRGVLDIVQEKIVSRKLLVFLTATGLLIGAGLDPDTWGMIAMFYVGGQSAIDAVQVWKHGKL